jgi:hypothetical protein
MIRVKLPDAPADLVAQGGLETASATAFYDVVANRQLPFAFKAYKLTAVKEALNAAFAFKCAYCESPVQATQPIDVEHFRPKGGIEVDGELAKPGYYWLAATWRNLLPSCTDCNRRRRQRLADGTELQLGKANAFPITDEAKRAKRMGEEKHEGRLLLHPALDKPRSHLRFLPDGIVQGTTRKGRESIFVYALLRDGLVRERLRRERQILVQIDIARNLAKGLDEAGSNASLEAALAAALKQLADFMQPEAPYSEMARQMIAPVLADLMP